MVDRQRKGRLRRRDDRADPDTALSRPLGCAGRPAARPLSRAGQGRRRIGRRRSEDPTFHQSLGKRRRGARGPSRDREFSPRRHHPGVAVRGRPHPHRATDLDGAGGEHDLPRLASCAVGPQRGPTSLGGDPRQPARPSRRDPDGGLCPRDRCRREPTHHVRARPLCAARRRARRHNCCPAHVDREFRPADRAGARPPRPRPQFVYRPRRIHARGRRMAWACRRSRPRCVPGYRRRTGAPPGARRRGAGAGARRGPAFQHRARLDATARPGRRSLCNRSAGPGGSGRAIGDRRLSVVRRLGTGYDDRPGGLVSRHRPLRRRPQDPRNLRALYRPGHAAERIPRRRGAPGIQYRRCRALVHRGVARLRGDHRGYRGAGARLSRSSPRSSSGTSAARGSASPSIRPTDCCALAKPVCN